MSALLPGEVFVPNGESRRDTAILVLAAADESGVDRRSIRSLRDGFAIPEALESVLYPERDEEEAKPKGKAKSTKKKASGDRAAKNTITDKE